MKKHTIKIIVGIFASITLLLIILGATGVIKTQNVEEKGKPTQDNVTDVTVNTNSEFEGKAVSNQSNV